MGIAQVGEVVSSTFGAGFEAYAVGDTPRLTRLAAMLTPDRDSAHDLVQETLVRVGCAWSRIDRDGNPAGYATMTMSRLAWRQSARSRAELSLLTRHVATETTPDDFGRVDDAAVLGAAMRKLGPRQRAVLVLRFYLDLSEAGRPGAWAARSAPSRARLRAVWPISAPPCSSKPDHATTRRPDMNAPMDADQELMERIARGDWGMDVESPALDDVMAGVNQRHRRRRTAIGASVVTGLAAAAAVTAVVGLTPNTPSADVPPAQRPMASMPTDDLPTASGPATPRPTQLTDCRDVPGRLLLSQGRYGGTPQRPSLVAYIENIGRRPCSLPVLPTLSIGSESGMVSPVNMQSAGDGPWKIRPEQALIMEVTAPPPSSCLGGGAATARHFIIEQGPSTYTLNFAGMTVMNCAPPTLTDLRVGAAPQN